MVLLETQPSLPSTQDELLRSLAEALETSQDEVFGLAGKIPEESLPTSAEEVALFRRVQRMTDDEKTRLLASLKKKQGGP